MKIKLSRTFGEIEIETADDKEAIAQASFWSELPNQCPMCGAELYLHYRETKDDGYKYYELHCRGVRTHYTQFGQYKTGGLFYKPNSWTERTFNTVQDERDAEIAKHNSNQEKPLAVRIRNAQKAIRDLGFKVEPQLAGETDAAYFESLVEQYNRLSK